MCKVDLWWNVRNSNVHANFHQFPVEKHRRVPAILFIFFHQELNRRGNSDLVRDRVTIDTPTRAGVSIV